uniref:Uncharacterized protein n=1 Tax=Arundo donax TaxID=35708 RepID=A0A0A8Y9F9_ARUDO
MHNANNENSYYLLLLLD